MTEQKVAAKRGRPAVRIVRLKSPIGLTINRIRMEGETSEMSISRMLADIHREGLVPGFLGFTMGTVTPEGVKDSCVVTSDYVGKWSKYYSPEVKA